MAQQRLALPLLYVTGLDRMKQITLLGFGYPGL
jgi:hypothetical protein